MRPRTVARLAFAAGVAVAAVGLIGGIPDPGVSDRVVEPFGPAPTLAAALAAEPMAAATAPAQRLAPGGLSGAALAPLSEGVASPRSGSAAAEVPVRSGLLDAIRPTAGAAPVRLLIGDLAVDAPVEPVGYDARRDEMEVPRSPDLVGWYRFSASPGGAGSAVLAAHVDFNGQAGAFFDLHQVAQGTPVVVVMDDGSRQRWEVVARRQYGKELLPTAALFAKQGPPALVLVTCGGPFDGRRYEDNVVVIAQPVGAADRDPGPA